MAVEGALSRMHSVLPSRSIVLASALRVMCLVDSSMVCPEYQDDAVAATCRFRQLSSLQGRRASVLATLG